MLVVGGPKALAAGRTRRQAHGLVCRGEHLEEDLIAGARRGWLEGNAFPLTQKKRFLPDGRIPGRMTLWEMVFSVSGRWRVGY